MFKILPIMLSLFLLGGGSLAAHNIISSNVDTNTNAQTTVSGNGDVQLNAESSSSATTDVSMQTADVSIDNAINIEGFVQIVN